MAQTHTAEFKIAPVVSVDDIEQLTRIHVDALEDDESAAVKFATKEEFRGKVEQMLRIQLSGQRDTTVKDNSSDEMLTKEEDQDAADWYIVKAMLRGSKEHAGDGEILGWASWLRENAERTGIEGRSDCLSKADENKFIKFEPGLGTFVRQCQRQAYATWTRQRFGARQSSEEVAFLSLRAVFVLPRFQRRGVGAALVRYGCERADRLGLHTLVTATTTAKKLYETVGDFMTIDSLEVDLDEWDQEKTPQTLARSAKRPYQYWFMARTLRHSFTKCS